MIQNDRDYIEEIGEAYRFRPIGQASIFLLLMILVVVVIEFLVPPIYLDVKVTAIIVIASFLFPIAIKERNQFTRACSLGFFFAAVSLMIYYTLTQALPIWPPTQTTTLLIAAVLAISIQLFEYLLPSILRRNSISYVIIVVISVAFTTLATMSFNLLPPFGPLTVWSFVLYALLFMIFTYAILPEKPI
jgi:hypothetical protein